MKTTTIRQKVTFTTTPHDVYEMLMDSKKHALVTGASAVISRRTGGKFSAYGGYASGKNIELVQDKKIVQTWRTTEWEEGHYSIVEFSISVTKRGCLLTLTQKNVPQEHYAAIKQGWIDYYWTPMKKMLENR